MDPVIVDVTEQKRLNEAREAQIPWKKWGPYLSERQWGTVREDYSPGGTAWEALSHDAARSRALRSFLTARGTLSAASVFVPGRGEYGKTCTLVMPASATTPSVRAKAASSSPGKPTITSVVRLKSASGARRRRKVAEL